MVGRRQSHRGFARARAAQRPTSPIRRAWKGALRIPPSPLTCAEPCVAGGLEMSASLQVGRRQSRRRFVRLGLALALRLKRPRLGPSLPQATPPPLARKAVKGIRERERVTR